MVMPETPTAKTTATAEKAMQHHIQRRRLCRCFCRRVRKITNENKKKRGKQIRMLPRDLSFGDSVDFSSLGGFVSPSPPPLARVHPEKGRIPLYEL